jgi:hypothetical protein
MISVDGMSSAKPDTVAGKFYSMETGFILNGNKIDSIASLEANCRCVAAPYIPNPRRFFAVIQY